MIDPEMRILVVDANILIDYAKTNIGILALAAQHLGDLVIPTPILEEEVQDLDTDAAVDLGLRLLDPDIDVIAEAASNEASGGGLSFYDWLCLILARNNPGWVVLSNDSQLLAVCKVEGIPTMRGLRLLLDLVECNCLSHSLAEQVAREICEINCFMGEKVLVQFLKALGE